MHNQRPASERTNLQLWNFLHACLQCDPLKRPEHGRVRGISRETDTESESTSSMSAHDPEEQHKSIDWSRILSTALEPGDVVGADRYSFPLADGPVRLARCEQKFEDQPGFSLSLSLSLSLTHTHTHTHTHTLCVCVSDPICVCVCVCARARARGAGSNGQDCFRSGVEAQLVVKPHRLLPFETFRSFRASLTSNRHHSPDLQVILDGRR